MYEDSQLNYYGFLYNGTTWTPLNYPGAVDTAARGIDGGNIVGHYKEASGIQYGFLYNGTSWVQLDYQGLVHNSLTATFPWDIDGTKIVGSYFDQGGTNNYRGFLFNGTTWTTLDYPGAYETVAEGIDGSNIVGCYYVSNTPGLGCFGFLYNGTTWASLDFPGSTYTDAEDIYGKYIVGRYMDTNYHSHGFLYDGTTWTTLDFPGADNTEIMDIYNNIIVGDYHDMNGNHGFMATPISSVPIPGALLLVSSGLIGLAGLRKKFRTR